MNDMSQVAVDLQTVREWAWFAAIAGAGVVLFFGRRKGTLFRYSRASLVVSLALLSIALTAPAGLGRVQPGARGIVLRFGAPTGRTIAEGLYYVVPLAERVVQINTQVNTVRFDRAQAITHDLEPVYADLAVSFHVEPEHAIDVYRNLRDNYSQRIVEPAVQDACKATAAGYTSTDLITRRKDVATDFARALADRIAPFGLGLDTIATTRFNFTYVYSQAAQSKVASVQRPLQAEQDLQRIRFESQQSVIRAKSEIAALKLQRNVPIGQLIRMRELDLQRRAIDKWDGHLPTSMGTLPFVGSAIGQHSD